MPDMEVKKVSWANFLQFHFVTCKNASKQAIKNHRDQKNVFLWMVAELKHHASKNEYLSCVKLMNTYGDQHSCKSFFTL